MQMIAKKMRLQIQAVEHPKAAPRSFPAKLQQGLAGILSEFRSEVVKTSESAFRSTAETYS